MIFNSTTIPEVHIIEPKLLEDDRGFFARGFCEKEFAAAGLESKFVQCNLSYNKLKGTTRGLHFQQSPYEEVKVVKCTRGAILDVAVDFRPESPTYLHYVAAELTEHNRKMLYVPRGFAHGYQTLTDDAEVFYHVSEFYTPGAESGLLWNDPDIGIDWPIAQVDQVHISEKDASWPKLSQRS